MRNLENEIWLPVVGYEGLYEVSNLGRVKSLERKVKKWDGYRTVPERILRPARNNSGYLYVVLCKDGKKKHCYIHRLVAQAFIPNPLNLPEVNHLDERPENNRVNNLEWCTTQYNTEYSQAKTVLQFTLDGKLVREWPSTHEAERLGGFDQGNISRCCLGKYGLRTHKGYIWKYKEAV